MAVKVGINGFGRIGRQIINVMADKGVLGKTLDVVAGLLDSPCMIKFKELFRRKIE